MTDSSQLAYRYRTEHQHIWEYKHSHIADSNGRTLRQQSSSKTSKPKTRLEAGKTTAKSGKQNLSQKKRVGSKRNQLQETERARIRAARLLHLGPVTSASVKRAKTESQNLAQHNNKPILQTTKNDSSNLTVVDLT